MTKPKEYGGFDDVMNLKKGIEKDTIMHKKGGAWSEQRFAGKVKRGKNDRYIRAHQRSMRKPKNHPEDPTRIHA